MNSCHQSANYISRAALRAILPERRTAHFFSFDSFRALVKHDLRLVNGETIHAH